ncbi:Protein CBR-SEU-1 [Caenorhabditis briggsae]|uniref:Protein CBR-SEU-1 n=1 Tax=Caenorhabditis briggsae TaxID=6238 RepID=A8WZY4_CAEBR|nr:Protein CBR-SEU-1 [Caenorhabditis briggsae]CAP25944.2 Protein CBR-SEU-1 [Caenorhabditis briggsae]
MNGRDRDRRDVRRPTFRDHRTPQFGNDGRRLVNPAHYPQRPVSPRRPPANSSPNRRRFDNNQRNRSPEHRHGGFNDHNRPQEHNDRRGEAVVGRKQTQNIPLDRSRSNNNVAARIQAPFVPHSSPGRHHQQQRDADWKRPQMKRPAVDTRPMSYATGVASATSSSSSRPRHNSRDRHRDAPRRQEDDKEKRQRDENDKKKDERSRKVDTEKKDEKSSRRHEEPKKEEKSTSSSSSRRRDGERKRDDDKKDRKSVEKKEKVVKEDEKMVVDETREEDEAVAVQGLEEVDSCEGDESNEQVQNNAEPVAAASPARSNHSAPASNASVQSDEEELDYEEDDIDLELGDDIDVETMKLAARGSSPSKTQSRRREDKKDAPSSSSDREKDRRRSRSPAARPRDSDRKDSSSKRSERSESNRTGGAGTDIKRIPSLLTMRIAAPPGTKKMENFYHSSTSTSSFLSSSSEGLGEPTFSSRWCQCSCAHHMPSTSSAGSLDASPSSSSSSSNSDALVSRIPSLMSLRTPFNNSCLFLAPPQPTPPRRSNDPAARIRAPSPLRRSFGGGPQRMEDHRGGRGDQMQRRRSPDRIRRDDRRPNDFGDRKRVERGSFDTGRNRSPLRRRPSSPPRGRPGEKVVASYRNGV